MRTLATCSIWLTWAVSAVALADGHDKLCATPQQVQQIQKFYVTRPGTLPVIAAKQLGLPEALVASGLGPRQSASAPREAFQKVWDAMGAWRQANFLIVKGDNVFEILSGVSAGAPSTRSDYFNIKYDNPLRGHLRPDQFSAIYAVAIPGKEDAVARGVLFYAADGSLVFGTFISGESLQPSEDDLRSFDKVMQLVRAQPSVCPAE